MHVKAGGACSKDALLVLVHGVIASASIQRIDTLTVFLETGNGAAEIFPSNVVSTARDGGARKINQIHVWPILSSRRYPSHLNFSVGHELKPCITSRRTVAVGGRGTNQLVDDGGDPTLPLRAQLTCRNGWRWTACVAVFATFTRWACWRCNFCVEHFHLYLVRRVII